MRCIECSSTESFICGHCYLDDKTRMEKQLEELQREILDLKDRLGALEK